MVIDDLKVDKLKLDSFKVDEFEGCYYIYKTDVDLEEAVSLKSYIAKFKYNNDDESWTSYFGGGSLVRSNFDELFMEVQLLLWRDKVTSANIFQLSPIHLDDFKSRCTFDVAFELEEAIIYHKSMTSKSSYEKDLFIGSIYYQDGEFFHSSYDNITYNYRLFDESELGSTFEQAFFYLKLRLSNMGWCESILDLECDKEIIKKIIHSDK